MSEKTYNKMSDDELREALTLWESNMLSEKGSAAVAAALQIRFITDEGNRRGLGLVNKYPIHGALSPEEEKLAVHRLGERIGYHRVIQLCEQHLEPIHAGPADKDYDYGT